MALWTGIPREYYMIYFMAPLSYSSPVLVAFSSFATAAAISDKPLTSDVIFPAISLFMLLQFPLAMVRDVKIMGPTFTDKTLVRDGDLKYH